MTTQNPRTTQRVMAIEHGLLITIAAKHIGNKPANNS